MELVVFTAIGLTIFGAGACVGHHVTRRVAWEDFLANHDDRLGHERHEWERKFATLDNKYAVERAAHKRTQEAKDWYKAELRQAREDAADEARRRSVGK